MLGLMTILIGANTIVGTLLLAHDPAALLMMGWTTSHSRLRLNICGLSTQFKREVKNPFCTTFAAPLHLPVIRKRERTHCIQPSSP
jgi:hypothetical protein